MRRFETRNEQRQQRYQQQREDVGILLNIVFYFILGVSLAAAAIYNTTLNRIGCHIALNCPNLAAVVFCASRNYRHDVRFRAVCFRLLISFMLSSERGPELAAKLRRGYRSEELQDLARWAL